MQTGNTDVLDSLAELLTSLPAQWVLGNKYLAPGYSNLIMKSLINHCEAFEIDPDIVQEVFKSTTEKSKLRMVVLDALNAKGPFRELPTGVVNPFRDEWLEFICDAGGEVLGRQYVLASLTEASTTERRIVLHGRRWRSTWRSGSLLILRSFGLPIRTPREYKY